MKGILIASLFFVFPLSTTLAQDDTCPQLVQESYAMTLESCESLGSDEACYGNISIDAQPESLPFNQSGDIVDVTDIESLRLSRMDIERSVWGISLMQIAALPSEDETPIPVGLVLFGDVDIENAPDSDFVAMQAFTFSSGVDDRPCEKAPDSGILIQTAEGAGEISLLVNEVLIDVGSTVYLQAEPGGEMVISVVEGQAAVTADGTTIEAPAGSLARIPLDDDGLADGPPEGPEPYDANALLPLPLVLLPEQIAIAEPIGADGSTSTSGDEAALISGEWQFTITDNSCDPSVIGATFNAEISFSPDAETLIWPINEETSGEFSQVEPGVYVNETDNGTARMERIAAEEMSLVITWADGCQDFLSVKLVSPAD